MKSSFIRAALATIPLLAVLSLAPPSSAQQNAAPPAPPAPGIQQAPIVSPAPAAPVQAAAPAPAESDKALKPSAGLR